MCLFKIFVMEFILNVFFSYYSSQVNVKELWFRLRREDDTMLKSFEDFIANVFQELKKSKSEFSILESALQRLEDIFN